jgi:hypothetical protein
MDYLKRAKQWKTGTKFRAPKIIKKKKGSGRVWADSSNSESGTIPKAKSFQFNKSLGFFLTD